MWNLGLRNCSLGTSISGSVRVILKTQILAEMLPKNPLRPSNPILLPEPGDCSLLYTIEDKWKSCQMWTSTQILFRYHGWDPPPPGLMQQGLSGAWEFAFLTHSQVLLMLMLNHWARELHHNSRHGHTRQLLYKEQGLCKYLHAIPLYWLERPLAPLQGGS